jgi:Cu2+-exporting ATPase
MTDATSASEAALALLNDPAELAEITRTLTPRADGARRLEAVLTVDGVHCAACVVSIEAELRQSVESISVNAATRRARLVFLPDSQPLSSLFERIERLGYRPRPVSREAIGMAEQAGRRVALWRMLVAGLCMMQVMMYAVPRYTAAALEMPPDIVRLLTWAEWTLSLPVLVFAVGPFFRNAWRDLRQRRIGMDVPVAVGVAVTFVSSSAAIARGDGEVWFDSLTMFVAFLLIGRWLESVARERALSGLGDLTARLPQTIERIESDGSVAMIGVRRLAPNDRIRIVPGQVVPADGRVESGRSHADESPLTGESHPIVKQVGDTLASGSLLIDAPLVMVVERAPRDSRMQEIADLIASASARKPRLAQLADRWAGPFLAAILVLAAAAWLGWQFIDPQRALAVATAVLVVSCPCALSLATPTALLAASGQMARLGLLARSPQTIESLAQADTFVFDKTGTLSLDRLALVSVQMVVPEAEADFTEASQALGLAAALDADSLHPAAAALRRACHEDPQASRHVFELTDITEHAGQGISAMYAHEGRHRSVRLGRPGFSGPSGEIDEGIILSVDGAPIARFRLAESIRPDTDATIRALREAGLSLEILSGDEPARVASLAARLGIDRYQSRASPQDKLARLIDLQQRGHRVAMVGDGINDAPVLAQAQVSISFATGAPLAQHQADLLILGDRLHSLTEARRLSLRALKVVRQNLVFAIVYNLLSIPLALAGVLPPWLAGLGMAASSVVVVLNAMRLAPSSGTSAPLFDAPDGNNHH